MKPQNIFTDNVNIVVQVIWAWLILLFGVVEFASIALVSSSFVGDGLGIVVATVCSVFSVTALHIFLWKREYYADDFAEAFQEGRLKRQRLTPVPVLSRTPLPSADSHEDQAATKSSSQGANFQLHWADATLLLRHKNRFDSSFGYLVEINGKRVGRSHELRTVRTLIGRAPSSDIYIDDRTVSRQHAVLIWREEDSKFVLYDLLSTNFTMVNGVVVKEPVVLNNHDRITIGRIQLSFLQVNSDFDQHYREKE